MQVLPSESVQGTFNDRHNKDAFKRLTPEDYSKAGILKLYDWSVREREAHDIEMGSYREYLMKLCNLFHKTEISRIQTEE
jgi:hypothetical protein